MRALVILLIAGSSLGASYSGYRRYLNGHDMLRVLQQHFGASLPKACAMATKAPALGFREPFNGDYSRPVPSAATVQWYYGCASEKIETHLEELLKTRDGITAYLGPRAVRGLAGKARRVARNPKGSAWNSLSADIKFSIARYQIHRLVGPGIMSDEELIIKKYVDASQNMTSVYDAVFQLALFAVTDDAFLTY